jgi:hypothetical protein
MTLMQAAAAGYLALGMLAFSGWTVYVFANSTLPRDADWTTVAIYRTGQGLIWFAIVFLAGGVFALAVRGMALVVNS